MEKNELPLLSDQQYRLLDVLRQATQTNRGAESSSNENGSGSSNNNGSNGTSPPSSSGGSTAPPVLSDVTGRGNAGAIQNPEAADMADNSSLIVGYAHLDSNFRF